MDWHKLEQWLSDGHVGKWQPMAPLSLHTSWRIGGPARVMVWPEDEARCAELLRYSSREGYPVRFL
ncbi:MAG: hypothetical protein LBH09_01940, partial [Peptococcaceae bacterium]|nr:hypothetical protein [Peptococcaceae bacterium]